MKKKKVIIIGAGIAGLSAASYLQRSGFDTEILRNLLELSLKTEKL
jgi:phytoene dehydrogenase-like protein